MTTLGDRAVYDCVVGQPNDRNQNWCVYGCFAQYLTVEDANGKMILIYIKILSKNIYLCHVFLDHVGKYDRWGNINPLNAGNEYISILFFIITLNNSFCEDVTVKT